MSDETLGGRIARLRQARRVGQAELAEAAGVHPITVSKWERDIQEPRVVHLTNIAHFLGIPLSALIPDSENVSREIHGEASAPELEDALVRIDGLEVDEWLKAWKVEALAAAYRAEAMRAEARAAEARARAIEAAEQGTLTRSDVVRRAANDAARARAALERGREQLQQQPGAGAHQRAEGGG